MITSSKTTVPKNTDTKVHKYGQSERSNTGLISSCSTFFSQFFFPKGFVGIKTNGDGRRRLRLNEHI